MKIYSILKYEIKDDINRVDYVAEIFISEINSL